VGAVVVNVSAMIVLGCAGAPRADTLKRASRHPERAAIGWHAPCGDQRESGSGVNAQRRHDRADHRYGMVRKIRNVHGVRRTGNDTNDRH